MAKDKNSFIAYTAWKETFDALPDEYAGKLVKHLFSYVSDENPKTDDVLINAVFANIKQQLKRDLLKWEDKSVKRSDIGRAGGLKSGEARRKQKEANEANASKLKQNEHDNVNVSVNDNVIKDKEGNSIYIEGGHLSISWNDMNKLIKQFGERNADDAVRRVLNYRDNAKYKSLYLTALDWLKKDAAKKQNEISDGGLKFSHGKLAI